MGSSRKRIGILGGSFDPVHIGHLVVAQEASFRYELDHMVLMPAARNPLKELPEDSATPEQRLAMLKLAIAGDGALELDPTELRAGGVSFTVDSLRRWHGQEPEATLYLLVGADAAVELHRWKEIELYRELCTLLVYNRPGSLDFSAGLPQALAELNLRWEYMPLPQLDISSTGIRLRVAQSRPMSSLLPAGVAEYIAEQGLYC